MEFEDKKIYIRVYLTSFIREPNYHGQISGHFDLFINISSIRRSTVMGQVQKKKKKKSHVSVHISTYI